MLYFSTFRKPTREEEMSTSSCATWWLSPSCLSRWTSWRREQRHRNISLYSLTTSYLRGCPAPYSFPSPGMFTSRPVPTTTARAGTAVLIQLPLLLFRLIKILHEEAQLLPQQRMMVSEGSLSRMQRKSIKKLQSAYAELWDKLSRKTISAGAFLREWSFLREVWKLNGPLDL